MGGSGFMSSGHKSVAKNRALRKGRNNLFERKGPKIDFEPGPETTEVPYQTRQKFRDQLASERAIDRRNSLYGLLFGLFFLLMAWINRELIMAFLAWMGKAF